MRTNNNGIEIKTRLHDGIYQSWGGGETRIVRKYNIGPRNLLKAIRETDDIIRSNMQAYGGIGAGETWLEIDGTDINEYYYKFGVDGFELNMKCARALISTIHGV